MTVAGPDTVARRLARIGAMADADIDLPEAALAIAAVDRPGLALGPYRRHLTRLTEAVRTYAGGEGAAPDLALCHEALVQVIARRYGYRGHEEAATDPDAADLSRVVDGRAGAGEALGLIYVAAARRLGWPAAAVAFPARPLVRLDGEGERRVIDPFAGGGALEPPQLRAILKAEEGNHAELLPAHFEEIGPRAMLLRLQRARKRAFLARNRLDDALSVVEITLKIAPGEASLWRESGLLNARLDRVRDAVAALEEYLRHDDGEVARYNTSVLLQELRARLT